MNIKRNILQTILIGFISFSLTACDDTKEKVLELTKEKEKKVILSKPEWDKRLWDFKDAGEWYQDADKYEDASLNIAHTYIYKIQDYEKALEWSLFRNSINETSNSLFRIAESYEFLKKYDKAILFYKKSYNLGNNKAATNIGYIYNDKDIQKAKKWYEKAIERVNKH